MPGVSYGELFSLTGKTYVLVAFIARLPLAMSQLGTLLLVSELTGKVGYGGAAAGALAVANAIVSPIFGALADKRGQRPVLLTQSVLGAAGLAAIVLLAWAQVHWVWLAVAAAIAGAFLPQVGSLARVRWRALARPQGGKRLGLISTAFSYEGAADEAAFVLGPALVGLIVAAISPHAALITAAVMLALAGVWFAVHPTANAVPRADSGAASGKMVTALFVALVGGQFALGLIFGSVQAGTTALATAAGEPGLAGLMHAILGVGSAVAGLAVVRLPSRFTLRARVFTFGVLATVFALPLLLIHSLGALVPVLLVLGVACAPYMISVYSLAEEAVPPARLASALTVLAGATGIGYAVGSTTAGRIADLSSHTGAYAVTVGAGLLAAAIGGGLYLRRRQESTAKTPAN